MNILGVDFSGAQNDRNTWLAQGFLENTRLSLTSCACVSRDELAGILAESSGPTVARPYSRRAWPLIEAPARAERALSTRRRGLPRWCRDFGSC